MRSEMSWNRIGFFSVLHLEIKKITKKVHSVWSDTFRTCVNKMKFNHQSNCTRKLILGNSIRIEHFRFRAASRFDLINNHTYFSPRFHSIFISFLFLFVLIKWKYKNNIECAKVQNIFFVTKWKTIAFRFDWQPFARFSYNLVLWYFIFLLFIFNLSFSRESNRFQNVWFDEHEKRLLTNCDDFFHAF